MHPMLGSLAKPQAFFCLDGFAVPALARVSRSLRSGTMAQAVSPLKKASQKENRE